eukprot:3224613-Pyramimonas_sp.AAC.1
MWLGSLGNWRRVLPTRRGRGRALQTPDARARARARRSSVLPTIEKSICHFKHGVLKFCGSLRRPSGASTSLLSALQTRARASEFCVVHNRKADMQSKN